MSNAYVIEDGQTTNYHGLQVSVVKRLSQLSFNGFYIWSKALASASLQTTGNIGNRAATQPEDYYDLELERQREDNDMRNQVVISAVWKPNYFESFNPVVATFSTAGPSLRPSRCTAASRSPLPAATTTISMANNNDSPNVLPGKSERVLAHIGRVLARQFRVVRHHRVLQDRHGRLSRRRWSLGRDGCPCELLGWAGLQRCRCVSLPRLQHLRTGQVPVPRRSNQRLQLREPE